MSRGTYKLSELLAELWDRANRQSSSRTFKRLLRWVLFRNEASATSDFSTEQPAYPATWGPDANQINWSGGTWG